MKRTIYFVFLLVISILLKAQETRLPSWIGKKVYIDPTFLGVEKGTFSQPFRNTRSSSFEWSKKSAYLFKRNTILNDTIDKGEEITNDSIIIGAYGTGKRPILKYIANTRIIRISGNNCIVNDIELNVPLERGANGIALSGDYGTINNCIIKGGNRGISGDGSIHIKILNTDISGCIFDGIYISPSDTVTIFNCYVHDQIVVPEFQNQGSIDNIHIYQSKMVYIDSLRSDHSNFPGKFCLIMTDTDSASIKNSVFIGYSESASIYSAVNKACSYENTYFEGGKYAIWGFGNQWVSNCVFRSQVDNAIYGGKNIWLKNTNFIHQKYAVNKWTSGKIWEVKNCIFYDFKGTFQTMDALIDTAEFTNNCFYSKNTDTDYKYFKGKNFIELDPKFVDAQNGNFRLLTTSPCKDKGIEMPHISTDIIGTPRPQGAKIDYGAYEFISGIPTTFKLSSDGIGCDSDTSNLTLSGSENNVIYKLYRNNIFTGNQLTGTGSSLSFHNLSIFGYYSVVAFKIGTNLSNKMTGEPGVMVNPLPNKYYIDGGGYINSKMGGAAIFMSSSENNIKYSIFFKDTLLKTSVGDGDSILLGVFSKLGFYSVLAENSMTKCKQMMPNKILVADRNVYSNVYEQITCGQKIFIKGAYRTKAGVFIDTFTSKFGYDSIVTRHLVVNPAKVSNNITICSGQSYKINGKIYTKTGIYVDTLKSTWACDSIVSTSLKVNALPYVNLGKDTAIYQNRFLALNGGNGFIKYLWNTKATTQIIEVGSGLIPGVYSYSVTVTDLYNCSNNDLIKVTVKPISNNSENVYRFLYEQISCGEKIFLAGAFRTKAGIYIDTFKSKFGYDSIVTRQLIVNPTKVTNNVSICSGQSYKYNNNIYTKTGVYVDTIKSLLGCEYYVTTSLQVNALPYINLGKDTSIYQNRFLALNAGNGFSYYKWNTNENTQFIEVGNGLSPGKYQYYADITDLFKCKNADTIIITIKPIDDNKENVYRLKYENINCGERMFIEGDFRTKSGIYVDTFNTKNGYDSIVTRHLIVNPVYVYHNISICNGQTYKFKGKEYNKTEIITDTIKSSLGCDTIVEIALKVNALPFISLGEDTSIFQNNDFVLNGGNGFTGYLWNTKETSQMIVIKNGLSPGLYSYNVRVTDFYNCSNSDTILLTIKQVSKSKGSVYKTVYEQINCGEKIFLAGKFRSNSGEYIDTFVTQNGYDSIVICRLVVNPAKLINNISICSGQSYNFNGKYYSKTGIYLDTLKSSFGCDTIVYTTLKVNALPYIDLGKDTTIHPNNKLALNGGNGFIEYLWSTKESSQMIVVGEGLTSGFYEYSVVVRDLYNCTNSDTVMVSVNQSLNLNLEKNNSMVLYPVPASNRLFFDIGPSAEIKEYSIYIYSLDSKLIFSEKTYNKNIDISSLTSGTYILKILSKQKVYRKQFVVHNSGHL